MIVGCIRSAAKVCNSPMSKGKGTPGMVEMKCLLLKSFMLANVLASDSHRIERVPSFLSARLPGHSQYLYRF